LRSAPFARHKPLFGENLMQRLLQGYRLFREERWPRERALYAALAEGQAPRLLVIACSDSRVDPATIFGAGPGELFVVRNVANLVPPFDQGEGLHGTSAAIEYAVRTLKVRTILVMGHARCGGVAAALDDAVDPDSVFLRAWIDLLAPARQRMARGPDRASGLERESIKLSLERLVQFPFVAAALEAGALALVGARFDIADGRLELLDQTTGLFTELV
jgi:carbonic anhydrase